MKTIVLIWLFILPFALQAQEIPYQQKLLYQNKIVSYTKMKTAGIVLTFGGTILSVAGIAMMANSGYDPYYPMSDAGYEKYVSGYLIAVLGISATAGGITLWSIGGSKVKKYTQKLNSISLNINPVPRQLFSIAYRF